MNSDAYLCGERANQLRTVLWSLRELIARKGEPTQRERFEWHELANLGVDLATQLRDELAQPPH